MDNSNKLPEGQISVDKLFHLHGVSDLESELFDAILTLAPIFSFKELQMNYISKNYTQEQILKAFQSLEDKNFLSYDRQFNSIKLHLQSIFTRFTNNHD
jgi:hypothetical protein